MPMQPKYADQEPTRAEVDALPGPGEVFEPRFAAVEDRLRQRVAFVNIHEGLMIGIVGEQGRGDREGARRPIEPERDVQPEGLTVRDDIRRRPGWPEHPTVGHHFEAPRQHFDNGFVVAGHESWLEKPLGGIDVQVVRHVENVGDERAVDHVALNAQVEVTERNGMS